MLAPLTAVLANFVREIRYSARSLARTPAWTLSLVVTIALGIASNASVDGFVRGLPALAASMTGDARPATQQRESEEATLRVGGLLRIAAITVLLVSCANVASFLLSRAAARSRETAVRVAIGATRRQLIRQIVADSLLISIAGAALGAVLAMWLSRIVPAFLFDQDARQMTFVGDRLTIAMIAIAGAAITTLCGLMPLIESRDDKPGAILQREGPGPSRAGIRIGSGLVMIQMAACTLLVLSTGLLLAGFRSALQTSAGSRLSNPILVSVEALQMSSKAQQATSGLEYFAAAARATRDVAGATSIVSVAPIPGNPPVWQTFELEKPNHTRRAIELERVPFTAASVGDVVMPPIAGRMFNVADAGSCGAVILSREAARRIGGENLVGRSIGTPSGEWADIVGVVATRDDATARVYYYAPNLHRDEARSSLAVYSILEVSSASPIVLDVSLVSPNYFRALALPLIDGRTFDESADSCRVAVINREAADAYFPGGKAVGGALIDRQGRRLNVIGVVGSAALHAAQRRIPPTVYVPFAQNFQPRVTLIAETGGVDAGMVRRLRARIAAIPGGREDRIAITTLETQLSRTAFAPARIAMVLIGASATIALLLGAIGLHGVMSDATRRRRREFALRIALGAQGGHVVRQVMAEGMRLAIAGTIAGLAASIAVARWLAQITPVGDGLSIWVWIAAPILLVIAVLTASVIPARSAAASDPLVIMRDQ